MQLVHDRPAGFKETTGEIVEVTLWEAFLLYNRYNVYNTLCTYSLDNAPVEKEKPDMATVTFRFMARDWNNTLKKLLDAHNIPVIKETNKGKEKIRMWQND